MNEAAINNYKKLQMIIFKTAAVQTSQSCTLYNYKCIQLLLQCFLLLSFVILHWRYQSHSLQYSATVTGPIQRGRQVRTFPQTYLVLRLEQL